MADKWEYAVLRIFRGENAKQKLMDAGEEGWEAWFIERDLFDGENVIHMKRRKE